MQGCQSNTHKRNKIPLSKFLICLWAGCKMEFLNVQGFTAHVNKHATIGKCLWESCAGTFGKKQDHRDHLRSHTGEKRAACPDCGTLFSNTTKLNQHCQRKPATPALHLHQPPPAGEYFQRIFFLVGNLVTLINICIYCSKTASTCGLFSKDRHRGNNYNSRNNCREKIRSYYRASEFLFQF